MILCTALCALVAWGETSLTKRAPASYLPDDDMIVKPSYNEVSFYQQYVASDKSDEVIGSRNQIQVWQKNQEFSEQYGFDSTSADSIYYVPSAEEKWEYFQDRYMRYLRRRGEKPLQAIPQDIYEDFKDSRRVDTIDELEAEFRENNRTLVSGKELPKNLQAKEFSFWKTHKIIFQPRLDQGLVILGIKGRLIHARAWVGINGKTEVNIQHQNIKLGFRAMFNYEADTGKYFTSLDQDLAQNLKARFIASKSPDNKEQDERLMLLYAKTF